MGISRRPLYFEFQSIVKKILHILDLLSTTICRRIKIGIGDRSDRNDPNLLEFRRLARAFQGDRNKQKSAPTFSFCGLSHSDRTNLHLSPSSLTVIAVEPKKNVRRTG